MGKSRKNLNQLYKSPLPIDVIALPALIPHNPISWLNVVYHYLTSKSQVLQFHCHYEDGIFKIKDLVEMENLWRYGFFGKGKLSRSDPSWLTRTNRRLGLDIDSNLTNEEVTELRRLERKKFKFERSKLQEREIEMKRISNFEELAKIEEEKQSLKNFKAGKLKELSKNLVNDSLREEDRFLIDENNQLIQLEYLQLMPVEVLFLKLCFSNIAVVQSSGELGLFPLFDTLVKSDLRPDNKIIMDYVVYHHFRSLGWCVRSGIKFGVDFLLYNRGPPFIHAEYSIIVLPNYTEPCYVAKNSKNDWVWSSSILRVIGGVKKTLIFVYVDVPSVEDFNRCYAEGDLSELVKLYNVTEVLYRRWISSRNRD